MKQKRIQLSTEKKKHILEKTGNICACCGCTLTLETMTVEHVIPLSIGGTYDDINLISLCSDCNKFKSNYTYFPSNYYTALCNTPLMKELQEYVYGWVKNNKKIYNVDKFPLLAPSTSLYIPLTEMSKSSYENIRQFVFDTKFVKSRDWEVIKQEIDINIFDAEKLLYERNPYMSRKDFNKGNFIINFFYCKNRVADSPACLFAIVRHIEYDILSITTLWSKSKYLELGVLSNICSLCLLYRHLIRSKGVYSFMVTPKDMYVKNKLNTMTFWSEFNLGSTVPPEDNFVSKQTLTYTDYSVYKEVENQKFENIKIIAENKKQAIEKLQNSSIKVKFVYWLLKCVQMYMKAMDPIEFEHIISKDDELDLTQVKIWVRRKRK